MKNTNELCMGCMEKKPVEMKQCPHCGFGEEKTAAGSHHLPYGSKLNQKYLIGKVLGEGGFGITYLGWDCNLEMKVAVKEYYPYEIVRRDAGQTTAVFTCTGKEIGYQKGREKFLDEARRLAKFNKIDGVVEVRDFFEENNTSYIVMEYLEGDTLKQYLEKNGGRISFAELKLMMKPILEALDKIHQAGFIHRDISPDNIMVLKSGKLKLLDFGAAREFAGEDQKTLSVMLKPGYAPPEQYSSKGNQGAWTDIYEFCATCYKCLSGEIPPDVWDRRSNSDLKSLRGMGVEIGSQQEKAIKKGLSLNIEERFQTVKELEKELYRDNGTTILLDEDDHKDNGTTILLDEDNHNGNGKTISQNGGMTVKENKEENRKERSKKVKQIGKRILVKGLKLSVFLVIISIAVSVFSNKSTEEGTADTSEETITTESEETKTSTKEESKESKEKETIDKSKENDKNKENDRSKEPLLDKEITQKLEFNGGAYYIGEVLDGKANGKGTFYYAENGELNGNYYEGEFINGVRQGEGKFFWKDGAYYSGEWKADKRSGYGEITYSSGDIYKGNWENDKTNGQGEYYWKNGQYYVGNHKDGIRDGYGELHFKSGDIYKGNWENEQMNGQGEMTYSDGDVYKGNWKDGKKSGYGEYYWKEGDVYKGNWKDGERNGQGTLYNKEGEIIQKGIWENGKLTESQKQDVNIKPSFAEVQREENRI